MTSESATGVSRRWWTIAIFSVAVILAVIWYFQPADTWIDNTAKAMDLGDYETATQYVQAALDARPNDPLPCLWMSRVLRRTGQMDQAKRWLERAERRGLTPRQSEREQWLMAAQVGDLSFAEPHLGELLQAPGEDAEEICRAFTLGYFANLRIQDALRLIESWQADYPHRVEPLFMKAYALAAINDDARAVAIYQQGLKIAPRRADMRLRLADSYIKLRQMEDAAQQFELAIDQSDSVHQALAGLAQCRIDLGQMAEARLVAARLLKLDRNNSDAQLLMGQIDLADGRYEDAVAWLSASVHEKPFRTDARYALAKALQAAGRDKDAQPHFEYLAQVQQPLDGMEHNLSLAIDRPEDAELRYQAGMAMLKYNSAEDGAKWLRGALQIDPQHAGARKALDDFLAGRFERFPTPAVMRQPLPPIVSQLNDGGGTIDQPDGSPAIQFADIARSAGIHFTYRNGEAAEIRGMLESVGGGVGVFDFDNDGRLDVMFAGGGQYNEKRNATIGLPTELFRNLGNRRFEAVATAAGVSKSTCYSHAIAVGDYDNDGFSDVLITGYLGLQLFHNQGDGTFEEVLSSGLATDMWTNSAAWGDVNGDGALDLFLVSYLDWSLTNNPVCQRGGQRRDICNPKDFAPLADAFYLSDGDGHFRDATAEMGIRDDGKGLGVVIADLDLDGDADIYVTNDTTANFLYRTEAGKTSEVGLLSGCAMDESGAPDGSMGTDVADFDGDGLPDIWVANYEMETFALYRNLGDCSFLHASQVTGVSAEAGLYVGWGTSFADFDRDADVDIFVTNGHPNYFPINTPRKQEPLLFVNQNHRWFMNQASGAGPYMNSQHAGRGSAIGDLDGDGDLDVVVSHINEPASLLDNRTQGNSHWIGLRLIGIAANRDAIGSWAEVRTKTRSQIALVKGGGSYLSTSDNTLFFGLGAETEIENVVVHWPGGGITTVQEFAVDRVNTVLQTLD